MIPHLFSYQLVVLGLLWLWVMLHAVWPRRGGTRQAQAHPLPRAPTVCGPDAPTALCPVCARSRASPSVIAGAPRADAPPPLPPGGHREAVWSSYGLGLSRLIGARQPARHTGHPRGGGPLPR
jgi:hypothetical protein